LQQASDVISLLAAVLEQQSATVGKNSTGCCCDTANGVESVQPRGERRKRLILQLRECRVTDANIRRIRSNEIETLPFDRVDRRNANAICSKSRVLTPARVENGQ
jgi:hypothetical protein